MINKIKQAYSKSVFSVVPYYTVYCIIVLVSYIYFTYNGIIIMGDDSVGPRDNTTTSGRNHFLHK